MKIEFSINPNAGTLIAEVRWLTLEHDGNRYQVRLRPVPDAYMANGKQVTVPELMLNNVWLTLDAV